MKPKKKEDQSVGASVLLRKGIKYSQDKIRKQSVKQRLKERLSRDCAAWDPFYIQLSNPDATADAGKCLFQETDMAVS